MLYDPVEHGPAASCESCRFWWQETIRRTAPGWGQCRRMPTGAANGEPRRASRAIRH